MKRKQNNAKARASRPTQEFLIGLVAKYEKRTAPITDEMAMDLMDTNETNHFLMLISASWNSSVGRALHS